MGDSLRSLYAVRSGTFKSSVLLENGRDQVTGFHISGEVLGMDGISARAHQTDCVALEDSEVCVLPLDYVIATATRDPQALGRLLCVMSEEITREQGVMAALGTMQADERVATFLLNLAQAYALRGQSPRSFVLRMTREEIGSYIGLKLETVSRVLARFQATGLIKISNNRHIVLLDLARLRGLSTREAHSEDAALIA